jgi:hypothetical protein
MKNLGLKNLLAIGKNFYQMTPSSFRWIFFPIKLGFKLKYIFGTLKSDLWIITGNEESSNEKLTILYAGSVKNKNYLINLAFKDPYHETYIGKTSLWNLIKLIKKNDYDCPLVIAEIHNAFRRLFNKKKCFFVPCWVPGEVDISDISSLINDNRSLKSDFKRMKENELNFEITNEQNKLVDFYNSMYIPYISKVYGDSALMLQYEEMYNVFKNSDLLFIKKGKECIAGGLIVKIEYVPHIWVSAVKDGNSDYVKLGALQALHYFAFHYLHEQGHKKVSLGHTRAFLKDGVLQYKRKWRLELKGISKDGIGYLIKLLSRTPGTEAFFLNNPFIYADRGKLKAAIFVNKDELTSIDIFEKIYKNYYVEGISQLFIYLFGDWHAATHEICVPKSFEKITVSSAEALF